jgi:hypothetical protein
MRTQRDTYIGDGLAWLLAAVGYALVHHFAVVRLSTPTQHEYTGTHI